VRKIKFLVASFLLLEIFTVKANPVLVNSAQKAALNFYTGKYGVANPTLSLAYTEKDANGVPVYYVFNVNSNKGFVIVTAEDAAHPIIGYSDEGPYVVPASNNNTSYWLQNRKKEVIALRTHSIAATSAINDEWTSYTSDATTPNAKSATAHTPTTTRDSVLPLCTTVWDQSPYYNADCPGGSVTGCVATAMAQIMKYWSYPAMGTGSVCYNDDSKVSSNYSEDYGTLCADFDTSHYIWSAMPNKVTASTYKQVAELMYECGVSVNMDYSPSGSGSVLLGNYPSAYYSYTHFFGYDASTINQAYYSAYTEANWIALLENELNNKRVVEYGGVDATEGGHDWVCDGYSATGEFHMNWGWSGQDNGYYAVTALNPNSSSDFTEQIRIAYGIQPPASALAVKEISDNTNITVYPNPSVNGIFNFSIPNGNGSYQVNVYNVLGQEVNTSVINTPNSAINIGAQAKGIYIYKLITQEGALVSTGRLVVQ